jgi:hypothetical protein
MELVTRKEMTSPSMVGPIAEGETAEQAVTRTALLFGRKVKQYAFTMYKEPIKGTAGVDQEFDVIIGSFWAN